MSTDAPTVRFAPSPTGFLHVGSARAALFNWLFARHTGGTFVLRIEDTDESRNQPELIDSIIEPLQALGLDWDEGPYFQSQRRERHARAVDELVSSGAAYHCDCTQEAVRERSPSGGYDGHCRNRDVVDGEGVVVRFRAPDDGATVVEDLIRGRVEFPHESIEDFVIRRSDGSAVFLVANAVDDAEMGITHAVRGEDLLNTTPKVVLLMKALGFEPPRYAHLPLLVNAQRKKLSKRRDDVALGDYLERGYLPEALVNYLATLGWGPPDGVEIRPLGEIVELFTLESVNKAPAFFDIDKLNHFNATYLRALPTERFVELALPYLPDEADPSVFAEVADDVAERVSTLDGVADLVAWMWGASVEIDEDSWRKGVVKAKRPDEVLDGVIEAFETCEWEPDTLAAVVREVGDDLGVRSQVPVRVAVTGNRAGIPLFVPLARLGRERTLLRLRSARAQL